MSFQFSISRAQSLLGKITYVHNSRESTACAFEDNEKGKIRILLPRSLGVVSVCAEIYNESFSQRIAEIRGKWTEQELEYDVYIIDLPLKEIGVGLYFYNLSVDCIYGRIYGYKSRRDLRFTSNPKEIFHFQFSISSFKYPELSNKYGGIMYHIFVDRFNKGGKTKIKNGAELIDDWSRGIPEYPAYPGAPLKNNTFYGGTLWGIVEKLDYLKSLGVSLLYLSPIFDAASNHKYDTGNYMSVDKMFGGEEALKNLIAECKRRNIEIILDGVFNHTGSDSLYFNREGNYESVGAYQSKESKYYSWYDFQQHPNKYTCWWGIDILPRINPRNSECSSYFVGEGGVIDTYSKMGISGFRLDVVDELPDEFVSAIKDRLASNNTSSVLYGEVWEDASNKIAYDTRKKYYLGNELDGVMNYPVRKGIIDYLTKSDTDALFYALTDIIDNAPERIKHLQMNLLGTHDTERILTILGGESSSGRSNDYLARKRMSPDEREKARKRLFMAYSILATVPGIPVIFYGDEAGLEGYHDPFNRMPYPWGSEDKEIIDFYKKIANIRIGNEAFKKGDFKLCYLSRDFLCFTRSYKNTKYLTFINNSYKEATLTFKTNAKRHIVEEKAGQTQIVLPYTAEIFSFSSSSDFAIDY